MSAILKSQTKKPQTWTKDVMDSVLEEGDRLYLCLNTNNYLMLEDFPKEMDGFYHVLEISDISTGSVLRKTDSSDRLYLSLQSALSKALDEPESKALFTVGNSSPSYSCAILRENSNYFLYDPHSRSEAGMATADGCAILTEHTSLWAICLFIQHLSASLSKVRDLPFEIAKVNVLVDTSKSDQMDVFEGFSDSEVSDGEVSCRMYMMQNIVSDVSVSDVSSVNSDDISIPNVNSAYCSDAFMSDVSSICSDDMIFNDVNLDQLNDSSFLLKSFDDCIFNPLDEHEATYSTVKDVDDLQANASLHFAAESERNISSQQLSDSQQNDDLSLTGSIDENSQPLHCQAKDSMVSDSTAANLELPNSPSSTIPVDQHSDNPVGDNEIPTQSSECIDDTPVLSSDTSHTDPSEARTSNRTRKRARNENNWKRNILKMRKNSGQSYITFSGKTKRAKVLKKGCGQACKRQCHSNISEEHRERIFHEFWGTGSYAKQREFISNSVKDVPVQRVRYTNKRKQRNITRKYTLRLGVDTFRVCKQFL